MYKPSQAPPILTRNDTDHCPVNAQWQDVGVRHAIPVRAAAEGVASGAENGGDSSFGSAGVNGVVTGTGVDDVGIAGGADQVVPVPRVDPGRTVRHDDVVARSPGEHALLVTADDRGHLTITCQPCLHGRGLRRHGESESCRRQRSREPQ